MHDYRQDLPSPSSYLSYGAGHWHHWDAAKYIWYDNWYCVSWPDHAQYFPLLEFPAKECHWYQGHNHQEYTTAVGLFYSRQEGTYTWSVYQAWNRRGIHAKAPYIILHYSTVAVSYTHLRAHETDSYLV